MRIIVYQGDENRAKIEKELTGDSKRQNLRLG